MSVRRAHRDPSARVTRVLAASIILLLLLGDVAGAKKPTGDYLYLSPVPESELVMPQNNIIIRDGRPISEQHLDKAELLVVGSKSGVHSGDLILTDDGETLVFNPHEPFAYGETVEVSWKRRAKTWRGPPVPKLSFRFHTTSYNPRPQERRRTQEMRARLHQEFPLPMERLDVRATDMPRSTSACDTLPADYPVINLLASNNPDPGHVFVSTFTFPGAAAEFLILDNRGNPVFFRETGVQAFGSDFRVQANGLLAGYNLDLFRFGILDASYDVIDSYNAGNGYDIDPHGFHILPNGHALLQIYDNQAHPMDQVVPGGRADAIVIGFVVQELDNDKNVVFQWRSWDYFDVTDMSTPIDALTDSLIDYCHGNSVEANSDGDIIISSRHMDEITKIDRKTGDIIWRMGRHAKNNEFTFVNDDRGFRHQHDARYLPNGNITLFDNGNFLDPEYSRAMEYEVDEENKVATLVWEYRTTPDVYGSFMGNVQRRANGSNMIGWGGTPGDAPRLTDLHADGSVAYELGMADRFWTYRAFRYLWRTDKFVTDHVALDFGAVKTGSSNDLPVTVTNNYHSPVNISCLVSSDTSFWAEGLLPFELDPGESETFDVIFAPGTVGDFSATLYLREITDTDLVAQTVELTGSGVSDEMATATDAQPARVLTTQPNPFQGSTAIAFELSRRGPVELAIYDVRGRKVETLVSGVRESGPHEAIWNAEGVAGGIYFYRLEHGSTVQTGRVVLLGGTR